MYINLDKFYSSNYRDFVHRQALEDALKLVAEIYLKDTKVDTILNITFSVDEYGENPIFLTYLDEEKKEHIVKLKPNITEALLERLKEYAKITYVDEQDEKLRQRLTQIIEQSKQEAIDTANNFTISHTNEVKNDILNIINQTNDDLKEYCDNKCEMTLLAGKNYTDTKADEINQRIGEEHEYNQERYVIGTINKDGSDTGKRFTEIGVTPNKKQYAHLVNFVDARDDQHEINHASGYLLNYDGYTNLVTNLSKAGIPIYLTMQDGTPLFVSEISFLASEFTNQDFISAELKDGVNDVRGFLINQENLEKLYSLDLSGYATKEELNSLDSKVDLVNQQVEVNKDAITPLTSKLSNIWAGHKAPFIYWLPNIDIDRMKLENRENDVKVTLNDSDVVYWRKNEYQPVDLSNYATKTESDETYATKEELIHVTEGLTENDQQNFNTLNDRINTKTSIYTKTQGQSTELRYPRATFTKLTNGDISFNPGISSDPVYGYLLNESQLTKLKNLDDNPTGSSPTIKFNNDEDVTKLDFSTGNPDSVTVTTGTGVKMNSKFITDTQISDIANNTTKLSEIPTTGRVPNIVWYPDGICNYWRLVKDGEYVRAHMNDYINDNAEVVTYLPKFKSASASEVSALKTLVSSMGESNPIEMTIEYNGNSLVLDNYSSYTTIGNSTIVNINCNFTAPFVSGTTPITNTLNISSETLKSFPTFMIDCIVNTSTNISSYTTTTAFPNNFVRFYVVTPVIPSNENIIMTSISLNGSFIFQQQ